MQKWWGYEQLSTSYERFFLSGSVRILINIPTPTEEDYSYIYKKKYSLEGWEKPCYDVGMFPLSSYFTLNRFAHKALWGADDPPWQALVVLEEYLAKNNPCKIEIEVPAGVVIERRELVSIGKGTIIEPGVLIRGPCIIGKNCIIRHGAYIRENVICGDACVIGHSAEVKHSILLNYAHATHFVYVGDSILGNWVNLGAGVKCANLRLDRRLITVSMEGKRWKTGLRKFGAIVGDRCQIGCNSVLNPGTMVGRECVSLPLVPIRGVIAPQSQISQNGIEPRVYRKISTIS